MLLRFKVRDCVETAVALITILRQMARNTRIPNRYNIFAWTTRGTGLYDIDEMQKGIQPELFEADFITLTPLVKDKKLRRKLTITDRSPAIFDELHIPGVQYRACARAPEPFTLHIAALPDFIHN